MRRLQNITDEPIQRHTILFEKSEIIFTLRFYPRTQIWMFDAEFGDTVVYGLKLSVGVIAHDKSRISHLILSVFDRSGKRGLTLSSARISAAGAVKFTCWRRRIWSKSVAWRCSSDDHSKI